MKYTEAAQKATRDPENYRELHNFLGLNTQQQSIGHGEPGAAWVSTGTDGLTVARLIESSVKHHTLIGSDPTGLGGLTYEQYTKHWPHYFEVFELLIKLMRSNGGDGDVAIVVSDEEEREKIAEMFYQYVTMKHPGEFERHDYTSHEMPFAPGEQEKEYNTTVFSCEPEESFFIVQNINQLPKCCCNILVKPNI